jgi:hypothetical protein
MKLKFGMDKDRYKKMRRSKDERLEVLMVAMDITVFWDLVMYSLLKFIVILE